MKTLVLDTKGKVEEKDIARKVLTKEFKIHTRDLRPVFSNKQTASILPRGNCIIVNFRSVKILISAKKVLIFNLGSTNVERINK